MSGEFPESECDTEKLCLIVRHFGTETSVLGQHIHSTQPFPRVQHYMGSLLTNSPLRAGERISIRTWHPGYSLLTQMSAQLGKAKQEARVAHSITSIWR